MGNGEQAQSGFRAAVETMARAVAAAPGNVVWEQDLETLKSWLS